MSGQPEIDILDYIELQWGQLTADNHGSAAANRIALPYPFITPSKGIFHGDQFYWDSYFIIQGLLTSNHIELARGMVDNVLHMVSQFGFVPMRNRTYNTGISQPPLLTSMIRAVFEHSQDAAWLDHAINCAEQEYKNYWLNAQTSDEFVAHRVHKNLSRYADHFLVHQTAEHESGWDTTSRFNNRCLDFLPVDLNAFLYKYEQDFAWYFAMHNPAKSQQYTQAATERRRTVHELMWNSHHGRFYDYDYIRQKQSSAIVASSYVPLWAGLATKQQAHSMANSLTSLIQPGGIVTSAIQPKPQKQWDYPNGWAPMQYLLIKGLERYEYTDLARDITQRWQTLVRDIYADTGQIWEKYDVVNRRIGAEGRYQNQTGFGWTNGVYLALDD